MPKRMKHQLKRTKWTHPFWVLHSYYVSRVSLFLAKAGLFFAIYSGLLIYGRKIGITECQLKDLTSQLYDVGLFVMILTVIWKVVLKEFYQPAKWLDLLGNFLLFLTLIQRTSTLYHVESEAIIYWGLGIFIYFWLLSKGLRMRAFRLIKQAILADGPDPFTINIRGSQLGPYQDKLTVSQVTISQKPVTIKGHSAPLVLIETDGYFQTKGLGCALRIPLAKEYSEKSQRFWRDQKKSMTNEQVGHT